MIEGPCIYIIAALIAHIYSMKRMNDVRGEERRRALLAAGLGTRYMHWHVNCM